MDGDLIARAKGGNAGTDRFDFAGKFVAWHQRFADDEIADTAFGKIMQIGTADPAGSDADFNFVVSDARDRPRFKAEIPRSMDDAGFHDRSFILRLCGNDGR
jgi:hypothetical protein